MPKAVKERFNFTNEGRIYIFCPACYEHSKKVRPDDDKWWNNAALHCINLAVHHFDGNWQSPTISPSVLRLGVGKTPRCHSFVRNGMIEYLGDCTHDMAGRTVALMDVPEQYLEENQFDGR